MIADALYVGDSSVDRVMLGDLEVWSSAPSLPVVHITGTSGTSPRTQFRAACTAYGVAHNTVVTLPFTLDTSAATTLNSMFQNCSALTTVPYMDTSNVTNMYYMFSGCAALTSVPDMDTAKVTDMNSTFRNCSSLTDGNVRLIGKHRNVLTSSMITGSGLTREPFYDAAGQPI